MPAITGSDGCQPWGSNHPSSTGTTVDPGSLRTAHTGVPNPREHSRGFGMLEAGVCQRMETKPVAVEV